MSIFTSLEQMLNFMNMKQQGRETTAIPQQDVFFSCSTSEDVKSLICCWKVSYLFRYHCSSCINWSCNWVPAIESGCRTESWATKVVATVECSPPVGWSGFSAQCTEMNKTKKGKVVYTSFGLNLLHKQMCPVSDQINMEASSYPIGWIGMGGIPVMSSGGIL